MDSITPALAEFKEFPKIFRYSRAVVVTEKLDGTNAAVIIQNGRLVGCQSRTRLITPEDDNYGFAAWANKHAERLASILGDGHHYGEWWGSGIQRGYGLPKGEKRFSLFNVSRWEHVKDAEIGLYCVPVLAREECFGDFHANHMMEKLGKNGSYAAPGFMKPEGIVIYHTQGNFLLKKTFEKDSEGKSYGA